MSLSKPNQKKLDDLLANLQAEQKVFEDNPYAPMEESAIAVHFLGSKFLEIRGCGINSPITVCCENGIRRFDADGSSIAAITEIPVPRLAYWGSVPGAPALSDLIKGHIRHIVAVDDVHKRCYVGSKCGDKGYISVYPAKGVAKAVIVDFIPTAIKPYADGIFCAGTDHKIRKLDGNTLALAGIMAQVQGMGEGAFIEELIVGKADNTQVLCAKTNVKDDLSKAYVWLNNGILRTQDVANGAFDAAVISDKLHGARLVLFYGKGKDVVAEVPFFENGLPAVAPAPSNIGHEILSVRYDSALNYVYATTSNQIFAIPFYRTENKMLDDRKKDFGLEISKPVDNTKVVHIWQ